MSGAREEIAMEPRHSSSGNFMTKAGGIVNLSGRDMLVLSVARQLGSGKSSARLLCCLSSGAGPEEGAESR